MLQVVGHGDLWHVLNCSKSSSQNSVEDGPAAQIAGEDESNDGADDDGEENMDKDGSSDQDRSLPPRLLLDLFELDLGDIGCCVAEEDQEQYESASNLVTAHGGLAGEGNQHERKADPLHAKLYDTQHAGDALECFQLFAAARVLDTFGQCEDVCESSSCRGGTE